MRIDIDQLDFVDGDLKKIVTGLEKATGMELTVTSLYRPGDSGVHGQIPLRGIDVRVRDQAIGEVLAKVVNTAWVYDPTRPEMCCAVLHGPVLHLHLQTHPRTTRRQED